RHPGLHNDAIQFGKKVMRRSLTWYTRPMHMFQGAVVRALQRISGSLQAHDASLQTLAQDLDRHNSRVTEQLATQRFALMTMANALFNSADRLTSSADGQPSAPHMLRENKKIVSYWDRAAETDALRETVTPEAGESGEQYLQNWVKVGEYVADKIMSYSPPNPVALEIGPGMGRISIPMSRQCQSILALDISPEMVLRTRETLAGLTNFQVQLITDEDLNFLPADHFDLAYAISCFQHADKKGFYRYLRGIRRALKPNGVLFFGVLNLCSEAGWGHFEAIVNNDYPEFFHTPDEIASYLKHAGYSSHQLDYEGETLWAIAHR
ncbi:MAG: class I SAM-dependent methyltransferase, partial [Candidatus Korobacteraceae bacterium]